MGFTCLHNSPSSHFPLDISDRLGLSSEKVFGRGDVEGSSYSFPHPGSEHCREQLWSSFTSVYMTPPLCFLFRGATPRSCRQEGPVPAKSHRCCRHQQWGWELVFSLFSPCPQQRQLTQRLHELTGLLFGKGRANNGHTGALSHVTEREKPVPGHREPLALG